MDCMAAIVWSSFPVGERLLPHQFWAANVHDPVIQDVMLNK